jgi:hypothetical protein
MRNVKVKFSEGAVRSLLANPLAPLGGRARVQEIRDVPDNVSNADLLRLWDQTIDCTWLGDYDQRQGRLSFAYSELSPGRIIRA